MKAQERKLLILAGVLFAAVLLLRVLPLIVGKYQEGRQEIAQLQARIETDRDLVENSERWVEQELQKRQEVAELQDSVFTGSSRNLIGNEVTSALRRAAGEAGVIVRDTPRPRIGSSDGWVVVSQEMTFLIDQQNILRFLEVLENSRPRLFVTSINFQHGRQQFTVRLIVTGFGREI